MSADDAYREVAARLGIAPKAGGGFGAGALTAEGRIFAMLNDGRLVVKLPAARCNELVEAGAGTLFDGGKGRPMREWLAVDRVDLASWTTLCTEALAFVRGAS